MATGYQIHGIRVENKKTKELVRFIKCPEGNSALRVLSGVRINLGAEYRAEEGFATEEEITKANKR